MKIVFWIGPAWETWGPQSIMQGGIGGSETAAIHMATELARWGHDVSIVGQVIPCDHDGVKYVPMGPTPEENRFECDVFISSRSLEALRLLKPRTRLSYLWCHDIHVGDDYMGDLRKYDGILCLSEWSKKVYQNYYQDVPREKFLVTRNGIDVRLFLREPKKVGRKIVYSSSPDRGLDRLLDFWPKIREIRPDAQLDVYYGFKTWKEISAKRKDKTAEMVISFYEERLARMAEHGVTLHGRVGQGELAKAFLSAKAWLYPTIFKETSCISAMEAQAAGAIPVTTRLAALAETVKHGFLIDPPNTDDRYRTQFLDHASSVLLDRNLEINGQVLWKAGREWALRNLSWTQVAERWEEMFEEGMRAK